MIIKVYEKVKCPHCGTENAVTFYPSWHKQQEGDGDKDESKCTGCQRLLYVAPRRVDREEVLEDLKQIRNFANTQTKVSFIQDIIQEKIRKYEA